MKKCLVVFSVASIVLVSLVYYACLPTYLPDNDSKWQNLLRFMHYTYLKVKTDQFCNADVPTSEVPIDVIIPVIDKDAPTLLLTIESVRANILQPIKNIYFIAPESKLLREIAHEKNCIFVLEDGVLPIFSKNTKRKGWIKQQYLKLNSDTVASCEHFLVIDADTLLIRPQIFVTNHKAVLNILYDYWFKRKQMVKIALGFNKFHNLDFTSHHMLLSKTKLKALKQHLEKLHGKPWQDALDSLDIPEGSFSEYELYGNFVAQRFEKEVEFVLGSIIIFPRNGLSNVDKARDFLCNKYKSLTMHSFLTIEGMVE